jgi:cytochrome c oxidase subunit 2
MLSALSSEFSKNTSIQCDAALPWQLGFQDGATPIVEGIVSLHDSIMFYLIVITVLVFWMLTSSMLTFGGNRLTHLHSSHGTVIELIWTITPAFVLLAIALPSFRLLYLLDEVVLPGITIKAVGH